MPNTTNLKGFYSTTSHSVFFEFYCPKTFFKAKVQLPKTQAPDTLYGLLSGTRPGFSIQGALHDMEHKHDIVIENKMDLIEEATTFAFEHFYHNSIVNYLFYKTHHMFDTPLFLNNFTQHIVEGCLIINISDMEKSLNDIDFKKVFARARVIYKETGKFIIDHAQIKDSFKEK